MATTQPLPGAGWRAILAREPLEIFSTAFANEAVLEASVLVTPLVGAPAIKAFFTATRSMYDRIAFTSEHRSGGQTFLSWEGVYRGLDVSGLTVLTINQGGAIALIQLFHSPLDQVVAFAEGLQRQLAPSGSGDDDVS